MDFDPGNMYAPVRAHETLCMFLALSCHVACVSGWMWQQCLSIQISWCFHLGGYAYHLFTTISPMWSPLISTDNSTCACQAFLLKRAEITLHFKYWGFKISSFYPRLYMKYNGISGKFLVFFIDDKAFAHIIRHFLKSFKSNLQYLFDFNFYRDLKTFVDWPIHRITGLAIH